MENSFCYKTAHHFVISYFAKDIEICMENVYPKSILTYAPAIFAPKRLFFPQIPQIPDPRKFRTSEQSKHFIIFTLTEFRYVDCFNLSITKLQSIRKTFQPNFFTVQFKKGWLRFSSLIIIIIDGT